MINRVHFENFKSLANLTVDLGRFTVLVGANGCGKSSVLRGIDLPLTAMIYGPVRLATDVLKPLKFQARNGHGEELTVAIGMADGDRIRIDMSIDGADGTLSATANVAPNAQSFEVELRAFSDPRFRQFRQAVYLHLDALEMSKTTIPESENPHVAEDGDGLASVLAWMKGAAEDEFAQITSDLARVVPGVKRIRTLRERVTARRIDKVVIDGQPVWRPLDESRLGDRFEIEFDNGTSVPADLLSEGTILALGLLTMLREPSRPKLALLDDIDRGLHLEAQTRLVAVLRDLMELDPELQIVCTTHSPYLLDLFKPEEVRVLALDAQRHTHGRPLVEHPDFEKWKFGTQTGELWAALGESWVTTGAPPG